ncbi:MAG TPA: prepilin-type N-terminal cleavage/methylation domain-containing protein [Terriglobales bacterium]|nr:prepilin-type N-terminal cleavage/methylation domain-containing protein [Terriglobales bacterium]
MKRCRKANGFSLIELLIVVAIILIIAAIAIPNLLRARISANEASAVASIRTIQQAELSYTTSYPNSGYAAQLANLGGANPCVPSPTNACLIDQSLAAGTKAGYSFTAAGGNPVNGANTTYVIGAAPITFNQSGVRLFCSTEDNVIRWDANSSKSTTPPSAQQCQNFTALQ